MGILFRTARGSRLHGFAGNESDYDWWTVVDHNPTNKKRYVKHSMVDDRDEVVVDLGTWLVMCSEGTPEALEAMFSRLANYDRLRPLRAGYKYVGSLEAYERTIRNAARDESPKMHRHALRLSLNYYDLSTTGRFNPTLNNYHRQFVLDNLQAYDIEHLSRYVMENGWGEPFKRRNN